MISNLVADFKMTSLSSIAVNFGKYDFSKAAVPATIGLAYDVPFDIL